MKDGQVHIIERPMWEASHRLKARGIQLILNGQVSEADVLWTHTHLIEDSDIHSGIPIVIDDARDSATIRHANRTAIREPSVKSVVKSSAYYPRSLYNTPHVENTIHGLLMAQALGVEQSHTNFPELPEEHFQKIRIGYSYEQLDKMAQIAAMGEPPPLEDREFDVVFHGTTKYGWEMTRLHREKCIDGILSLNGHFKIAASNHRVMSLTDYIQVLRSAKIVLCPWGYGERTHREYEAALCGCVVMRPDTSFSETVGMLYQSEHYVRCSPTWSDVRQRVAHTLDDLPRAQWMAFEFRRRVISLVNNRDVDLTTRIASIITEAAS